MPSPTGSSTTPRPGATSRRTSFTGSSSVGHSPSKEFKPPDPGSMEAKELDLVRQIGALRKELQDVRKLKKKHAPKKSWSCCAKDDDEDDEDIYLGSLDGTGKTAERKGSREHADSDSVQSYTYHLDFAMKMMHVLWPNAQRAFATKIQQGILPTVIPQLPAAMQDLQVSRIHLGANRPKMGPLKLVPPAYDKSKLTRKSRNVLRASVKKSRQTPNGVPRSPSVESKPNGVPLVDEVSHLTPRPDNYRPRALEGDHKYPGDHNFNGDGNRQVYFGMAHQISETSSATQFSGASSATEFSHVHPSSGVYPASANYPGSETENMMIPSRSFVSNQQPSSSSARNLGKHGQISESQRVREEYAMKEGTHSQLIQDIIDGVTEDDSKSVASNSRSVASIQSNIQHLAQERQQIVDKVCQAKISLEEIKAGKKSYASGGKNHSSTSLASSASGGSSSSSIGIRHGFSLTGNHDGGSATSLASNGSKTSRNSGSFFGGWFSKKGKKAANRDLKLDGIDEEGEENLEDLVRQSLNMAAPILTHGGTNSSCSKEYSKGRNEEEKPRGDDCEEKPASQYTSGFRTPEDGLATEMQIESNRNQIKAHATNENTTSNSATHLIDTPESIRGLPYRKRPEESTMLKSKAKLNQKDPFFKEKTEDMEISDEKVIKKRSSTTASTGFCTDFECLDNSMTNMLQRAFSIVKEEVKVAKGKGSDNVNFSTYISTESGKSVPERAAVAENLKSIMKGRRRSSRPYSLREGDHYAAGTNGSTDGAAGTDVSSHGGLVPTLGGPKAGDVREDPNENSIQFLEDDSEVEGGGGLFDCCKVRKPEDGDVKETGTHSNGNGNTSFNGVTGSPAFAGSGSPGRQVGVSKPINKNDRFSEDEKETSFIAHQVKKVWESIGVVSPITQIFGGMTAEEEPGETAVANTSGMPKRVVSRPGEQIGVEGNRPKLALHHETENVPKYKSVTNTWEEAELLLGAEEVESLIWEMPFQWDSDMLIEFSCMNGLIKFGCEEFKMDGMMTIEMRPILNEIPLYGGLKISFINPPKMEFKFVGTGSGIAQVPVLAKKMQQQAIATFSKMFVLPNSMFIKTVPVDKLDLPSIKFKSPPLYCMRIEILEMRNLPAADYRLFSEGTSDPYAVYKLGPISHQTSIIEKTLHPVWRRKHKRSGEFMVYNNKQRLYVDVFDHDFLSADDHICRGSYEVTHLEGDQWFDLEAVGEAYKSTVIPKIRIRGTKLFLSSEPPVNPSESAASNAETWWMAKYVGGNLAKDGALAMAKIASVAGGAKQPSKKELEKAYARRPKEYLLEIKVYGASGCKAAGISAVNLKLEVENELMETGKSLVGSYKTTAESDKNVPVAGDVIQQLKFAGYSGPAIAKFLGCDLAKIEAHVRGAHEEVWCRSFFVFIRDPNEAKVKTYIGGHKVAGEAHAPYRTVTEPGIGFHASLAGFAARGLGFAGSIMAHMNRKKGKQENENLEDLDTAISDQLKHIKEEAEEENIGQSDVIIPSVGLSPEVPQSTALCTATLAGEDCKFTRHVEKKVPPNIFEVQSLMDRKSYSWRTTLRPAGKGSPFEIDIAFQLRFLCTVTEEADDHHKHF